MNEIGELLISKGADINAKTQNTTDLNGKILRYGGKTPLHYAAENNSKEIGELLITKGADINAIDIIYLNIIIFFLLRKFKNKKGNLIRRIKHHFIRQQRIIQDG